MTTVIPAIDLQNGRCVRLRQGRFDSTEVFADDPLGIARDYASRGARRLHLVDLDAAEGKGHDNRELVARVTGELALAVQAGGGVRRREDVMALLDAGVQRVVVGSLAITEPERVGRWLHDFGPETIVLALDVRIETQPMVRIHGWQTATPITLWDALAGYAGLGVRHVLCTDIGRDGMQAGPNTDLYRDVMQRFPSLALQASGGVRDRDDIAALDDAGVPFAISGRALLEGTLSLEDGR